MIRAAFLRKQLEEEEQRLIEEETIRRVEEAIRERVEAELKSDAVKAQIAAMIEEGRKRLEGEVQAQLEAEKQALLEEARRKEVSVDILRRHLSRVTAEVLSLKNVDIYIPAIAAILPYGC